MPQLDVSFMLVDPMLADTFDVRRRREVLVNGRATVENQDFLGEVGVVTQDSPSELMKRDDAQTVPRRIFVATMFQAQGIVEGYQADQVMWNGTTYTVISCLPYSRYGQGFYEIIAESQKAMDTPQ